MDGSVTPTTTDHASVLLLLYSDRLRAASLFGLLPGEQYEIVVCSLTALVDRWIEDIDPDLVLIEPPGDHGGLVEACSLVRSATERPIIVLSPERDEAVVTRAFGAGIDEYLSLPIGGEELAARIAAMLRRRRRFGLAAEPARIGGVMLDPAQLSVHYDGKSVLLSPNEFRLLSCLASAAGKVVTHEALMSRVWGAEYVDSRHYLHLYIRYLREKLEEDPASPKMILSEWGVGYRFQPPAPNGSRRRDP